MNKKKKKKPEVLVTDLYLEGVLCQSASAVSAASIEDWQEDTFVW